MGLVYKALDTRLDRTVAVKVLTVDPLDNPNIAERFMREARGLARLNHPNLLQVYNVGSVPGCRYFAMELLEGETLSDAIHKRKRIPAHELIPYIAQIISAVHYIHTQGIVHRDIKSSNIMLCGSRAVLMDFGLAKDEHLSALTGEGAVLGTPDYMSPEAVTGAVLGPAADIYGLGVVLYEALSGVLPFTGRSATTIMQQQVEKEAPALLGRVPGLAPELAEIVHKCLAKQPAGRYLNCIALSHELKRVHPVPELNALAEDANGTVRQMAATGAALQRSTELTVPEVQSPGFTAADTLVADAEQSPRKRSGLVISLMWLCAGFFGVLLVAIAWQRLQPEELKVLPAPWKGQAATQHKANGELEEIRWIEFNMDDPDPEKWYDTVERRQADGSWVRQKVPHNDLVGERLEFHSGPEKPKEK